MTVRTSERRSCRFHNDVGCLRDVLNLQSFCLRFITMENLRGEYVELIRCSLRRLHGQHSAVPVRRKFLFDIFLRSETRFF